MAVQQVIRRCSSPRSHGRRGHAVLAAWRPCAPCARRAFCGSVRPSFQPLTRRRQSQSVIRIPTALKLVYLAFNPRVSNRLEEARTERARYKHDPPLHLPFPGLVAAHQKPEGHNGLGSGVGLCHAPELDVPSSAGPGVIN